MRKNDLLDVSFLFPVRIESIERLENLIAVIEYLTDNFDTNICVLEASGFNNKIIKKLLPKKAEYIFEEDFDPIFHRTRYINKLVKFCNSKIIGIWDTDIIIPKKQLIDSIESLRNNLAAFVLPYDNNFLDTTKIIRELYLKERKISILTSNKGRMQKLYHPHPVGGAFFAQRQIYIKSGLENENFYGWGREDGERINRWKILDYKVERIKGDLFHLTHARGINSGFHDEYQAAKKNAEFQRIVTMSKEELEYEISTWQWL